MPKGSRLLASDAASYKRPLFSVAVSVCPQHGLCHIENVCARLESLQCREPRRLPACIFISTVTLVVRQHVCGCACLRLSGWNSN